MPDHFLDEKGGIHHIEGRQDGVPPRIFKPIAYLENIIVYEEQRPQATPTPAKVIDAWED